MAKRRNFQQFACKLADVTLQAINSGVDISRERSFIHGTVCCPLGSHPELRGHSPKPAEWDSAPVWKITSKAAFAFALGFDNDVPENYGVSKRNSYYRLGQAYAARFP